MKFGLEPTITTILYSTVGVSLCTPSTILWSRNTHETMYLKRQEKQVAESIDGMKGSSLVKASLPITAEAGDI